MVMMQGKVPAEFDAAAKTLLANGVTDAGTDTDVNTAVDVDTLLRSTTRDATKNAYWDDGSVPMGLFYVNIHVTAISGSSSTFAFQLLANTQANMGAGSPRVVGQLGLVTADGPGFYRFAVDAKTMQKLVADMTHVALQTVKATGSPSVTYTSWVTFAKA